MKTILITGSTDGIGKATAMHLAKKDNQIIIHGRDINRISDTVKWIKTETGSKHIESVLSDFASLDDVKNMTDNIADRFDHIDILINNAGVITPEYTATKDNLETIFQVNHLAPFLLTLRLLPLLKRKKYSQIVNVASISHAHSLNFETILSKNGFDPYEAYEISKLANILFTYKLAKDLKPDKVLVNTLHPGEIRTKLLHVLWSGGVSVERAVKVIDNVISVAEANHITGKYFVRDYQSKTASISYDRVLQNRMWDFCQKIIDNIK